MTLCIKNIVFSIVRLQQHNFGVDAGGTGPVVADSVGGWNTQQWTSFAEMMVLINLAFFSLYQHFYTTGGKYEKAVIIVVLQGNISRD